jgi:bifunctional non-homologous end joining protein LigD
MAKDQIVDIAGKQLRLSNLDKVLYPAVGFTKAQVIDYFVRIAPVLLPHLKDRPLTLKRYPEGVDGMFFYEKTCPKHRPEWVQTAQVWSEGRNDYIPFCLANDLPTLVWAANLADLELHTSLSLAADVMRPTMLVFDLDPGPPANIVQCCKVGLWVRELFDGLGMESFAKTSGSKGLQVYIPLNTPVTYDETKPFAHAVARLLEDEHHGEVVSDMKKSLRTNKVFVDWSQNDDHKTTICVYSLRAKERPTVSTPVTWVEVEACFKNNHPDRLVFTTEDTLARVEKMGDIFEPVLKLKQKLPKAKDLSDQLAEGYELYSKKLRPTVARKGRVKKAEEVVAKKKRVDTKSTPLKRKTS